MSPATDPTSTVQGTRGVHHITAIASDPARNVDFYTRVLGLRLVKKTVNFDDPGTYHLYYGDDVGSPGTILTFFPWPHVKRGVQGAGFQTATAFAVPVGSVDFWRARLASLPVDAGVVVREAEIRFGQRVLPFEDHDGMRLELVEDGASAPAMAATVTPARREGAFALLAPVPSQHSIRGFHSATLTERTLDGTDRFLRELLGLRLEGVEGKRHRFATAHRDVAAARLVDVLVDAGAPTGKLGGGVVHHIAFRAESEAQQLAWHATLVAQNRNVSPQMDRNYFRSIYFREPGGVLFEVATDSPGFSVDESQAELGTHLKLPEQYEHRRSVIEQFLPKI
jgi:glyoxalase family protein